MASDVQYRPKRQLVVSVSDGTGMMHLRFLHFFDHFDKLLTIVDTLIRRMLP